MSTIYLDQEDWDVLMKTLREPPKPNEDLVGMLQLAMERAKGNTLEDAVRRAKIAAGLDPDQPALPSTFMDRLDAWWHRRFWHHQLDRIIEKETL